MHIEEDLTQMTESELWKVYGKIVDERRAHSRSAPDPHKYDNVKEYARAFSAWDNKRIELMERSLDVTDELMRRWQHSP